MFSIFHFRFSPWGQSFDIISALLTNNLKLGYWQLQFKVKTRRLFKHENSTKKNIFRKKSFSATRMFLVYPFPNISNKSIGVKRVRERVYLFYYLQEREFSLTSPYIITIRARRICTKQ